MTIVTPILKEIEQVYNAKIIDQLHNGFYLSDIDGSQYIVKIFENKLFDSNILHEISSLITLSGYPFVSKVYSIFHINNGEMIALILDNTNKLEFANVFKHDRQEIAFNFLNMYSNMWDSGIIHNEVNESVMVDYHGNLFLNDLSGSRRRDFRQSIKYHANKHLESISEMNHSNVNLLHIFNVLINIFNINEHITNSTSQYPINIWSDKQQINNLVYLLNVNSYSYSKIKKIFKYINTKTNNKFRFSAFAYHIRIGDDLIVHENNLVKYRNLIKNIPKPFYSVMKKLLNLNFKTRWSFNKFYEQINKMHYFNLLKPKKFTYFEFGSFQNQFKFSFDISDSLIKKYDHSYLPEIYANTFYHYALTKDNFKLDSHDKLFSAILSVQFNLINNIDEPDEPNELMIEYIKFIKGNLYIENPYKYISKMWLIKWSEINKLLFDYWLCIISTHTICHIIDPYLLCVIITVLICRKNMLIPIKIDVIGETIKLPSSKVPMIPLTKKTINLFIRNEKFMMIIDKLYGYYAKLHLTHKLNKLNKYFIRKNPKMEIHIGFYQGQINKFLKTKTIELSESPSVYSTYENFLSYSNQIIRYFQPPNI
jgi:hypothetical protein